MSRLAVIPVAMLFALAACGGPGEEEVEDPVDTAANEETPTDEPTKPVELDLVEAGGACTLIDSVMLNEITGEDFRFASGWPSGEEEDEEVEDTIQTTCVVGTGESSYPDLSLFVFVTEASAETYEEEDVPDKAKSIDDLGEVAFRIVHTEDTGAGPQLQMGWYDSGNSFEMRYTTPEDTDADVVRDLVSGLTDLAKAINQAHAGSEE